MREAKNEDLFNSQQGSEFRTKYFVEGCAATQQLCKLRKSHKSIARQIAHASNQGEC
jgi:hypothetical protein